jgi:hypothetical protein
MTKKVPATRRSLTPCKQCGKRRRLPAKYMVPRIHYERDEFCSRRCCEEYHSL